jgi:hypothetical protein
VKAIQVTVRVERDRLPGGLSLRRARRALRRARHFVTPYEDGGIEASGQPTLLRLVEEVAWYVGARPPDRLGLRGFGGVHVNVRGGRIELWMSVPMLLVQPADEIRALVAHELSTLHPVETELVAQLYGLPDDAESDRLTRWLQRRRPTSYRPVRTVRRLVAELETRADAAASRIAGARNAAIAQVKEARLSVDCQNLVNDVEEELDDGGCDAGLVDVFTQWLDRLQRYGPEYPMSVDRLWRRDMARWHPGLATAIADLRPDELDLGAGDQLVEVAPFSADQVRALAADAFNQPHEQWMTTAAIPDSVWRAAIQDEGRHILESLAEGENLRPSAVGEAMAMACSVYHLNDRQDVLIALAEYALIPRGWRRAHPMQPGVLIDPSGTEHDLRPVTLGAVTDPGALTDLTQLVDPDAVSPSHS